MKKILLASTVFFAAGAVSAQAAEPVKLSIGGFMLQQVGYADQESHMKKVSLDQQSYAQVNFGGSTKLDNGMTIGVDVHTYATQGSDSRNAANARGTTGGNSNVRRAWITVGSAYGQLLLGQREDFGAIVHTSAPDMGWGLQGGDWYDFIAAPVVKDNAGVTIAAHNANWSTDNSRYSVRADKITYITPSWEGLQAGATYTPDIATKNTGMTSMASNVDQVPLSNVGPGVINGSSFAGDQYQIGLAYKNTLGPVGVKADVAYSIYDMASMQTYQSGLQLSYAGFTLGGSYFYRDVGNDRNAGFGTGGTAKAAMRAGQNYDVAIAYQAKDFGVSFGYFHDQSKSDVAFNGLNTASTTDVYALSGSYTMGPGIDWKNSLYYVNYDNEGANENSNDGIAFVTGVKVSF